MQNPPICWFLRCQFDSKVPGMPYGLSLQKRWVTLEFPVVVVSGLLRHRLYHEVSDRQRRGQIRIERIIQGYDRLLQR